MNRNDLAPLPDDELVVQREPWGEVIVASAPAEFAVLGERLWQILGFPARWPEFTIVAPEGFSLIGGVLTVNGTNARPRYVITEYLPASVGYLLERLP